MKQELEIYIHIPFCVQKCAYCDFLSGPAGREEQEAYVRALRREISTASKMAEEYEVSTVFLGGGTPSILPPEEVDGILRTVRESFSLSSECGDYYGTQSGGLMEKRRWKRIERPGSIV